MTLNINNMFNIEGNRYIVVLSCVLGVLERGWTIIYKNKFA